MPNFEKFYESDQNNYVWWIQAIQAIAYQWIWRNPPLSYLWWHLRLASSTLWQNCYSKNTKTENTSTENIWGWVHFRKSCNSLYPAIFLKLTLMRHKWLLLNVAQKPFLNNRVCIIFKDTETMFSGYVSSFQYYCSSIVYNFDLGWNKL